MRCWTLEWKEADRNEFVRYWASQYLDTNERLYVEHIEQPLTADTVRALFQWKNGGMLSVLKQRSVETNYIARLDELARLPSDLDGAEFLRLWPRGGAIWRIFWLHCWQPKRFPIYDQHVYRAATSLSDIKFPRTDRLFVSDYGHHNRLAVHKLTAGNRPLQRSNPW